MRLGDLNYGRYERAAFTQLRGLRGVNESWEEIIAASQRALLEFQDLDAAGSKQLLLSPRPELIAAARCLDSSSRFQSQIDIESRVSLAVEAAAAYSMLGNFLSSKAVLNQEEGFAQQAIQKYRTAILFICPLMAQQIQQVIGSDMSDVEEDCLEAVSVFLKTGTDRSYDFLKSKWLEQQISAFDEFVHKASVFRHSRIAINHLSDLSIVRLLLGREDQLLRNHINKLCVEGRSILLPSQWIAITQHPLLDSDLNVLLSMPTSTGKTLLGQLSISRSLANTNGLAVYIAPYQALANQVFQGFKSQFPKGVVIERAVGGYSPIEDLDPANNKIVLVCTPERFDAIIRLNKSWLNNLRAVVVDEAHTIERNDRGVRLEGILTRLLIQQEVGKKFRLVLMSAVLTNLDKIKIWARVPDQLMIKNDWTPTARRLAIWSFDGRLDYYRTADKVEMGETSSPTEVIAYKSLSWPFDMPTSADHRALVKTYSPALYKNIAFLFKTLYSEYQLPILCVSSTKAGTRQMAFAVASEFPVLDVVGKNTDELLKRLSRWSNYRLLSWMLKRGVAYHNAGLPKEIREGIERACEFKELIGVVATTTLAEGVDLPFRFTILADWLVWRGSKEEPMSPLLFRNIAGRCGRAGAFTEGDTIIFDNTLGNTEFTHPGKRTNYLENNIIKPQAINLNSSLWGLSLANNPIESSKIRAVVESQYAAAVLENENADDLKGMFVNNMFSADVTHKSEIDKLLEDIENEFVTSGANVIAIRNSPVKLTDYGLMCVFSGFSPKSCTEMKGVIEGISITGELDPIDFLVQMTRGIVNVPEITSGRLLSLYKQGSKFLVKETDLKSILEKWIRGESLEKIFSELPYVLKSKRSVQFKDWITGLEEPTTWDDEFDKFQEFVSDYIQSSLPWVCRFIDKVTPFLSSWSYGVDWVFLSELIENGVDTPWAIEIIKRNNSFSRTSIAKVGRVLSQVVPGMEDRSLNYLARKGVLTLDAMGEALSTELVGYNKADEIKAIVDWIFER